MSPRAQLDFDEDSVPDEPLLRNITIKNNFTSTFVAIHEVVLPPKAAKYFKVSCGGKNFPVILSPGEIGTVVELKVRRAAWLERNLNSTLVIKTNVTDFEVPLLAYHGRMISYIPGSPSQEMMDYGTVGHAERKDLFFAIINRNPVDLILRGWGSNITGSLCELVGVGYGDELEIKQRRNFSDLFRRMLIKSNQYMVFRLDILTPKEGEEEKIGGVYVETDYHAFHVPYRFQTAHGSLNTAPKEGLFFPPAFPGSRSEVKLRVYSSFSQHMKVDSVMAHPPDPRFIFKPDPKSSPTPGVPRIVSGQKNYLGKLIFDPAQGCRKDDDCYAGFSTNSKFGREWFQATTQLSGDVDVAITHSLRTRRDENFESAKAFNLTLKLDTDQVRGFLFQARAVFSWPRVLESVNEGENNNSADQTSSSKNNKKNSSKNTTEAENNPLILDKKEKISFPLTQVGNSSFRDVLIRNPSTLQDLFVHLIPLSAYPNGIKFINLLHPDEGAANYTQPQTADVFRILTVLDSATKTPMKSFVDEVETKTGRSIHPDSKAFIIKAGHSAKVRLRFRPNEVESIMSAIFVRNNLTGVEILDIDGQSVSGELNFGPWKSRSEKPDNVLRFEVKEKHLKDCEVNENSNKKRKAPLLTVRRSFKLKNTGQTSLYVSGFSIEDEPCEGYGFKVLDGCDGFSLNPDEHREIDIAFTPDFTLSQVSRTLSLHSTLSPPQRTLNFTMSATLPTALVAQCAAILPRPPWEVYLYYGANAFMVGALLIVLVAAFYESDRILKCTVMLPILTRNSKNNASPNGVQPPFDLRQISKEVNNELKGRPPQPDISILSKPLLVTLPWRIFSWPFRLFAKLTMWKEKPPEVEPTHINNKEEMKPKTPPPPAKETPVTSKRGRKKQQQLRRRMNTSKMNSSSDFNDNVDTSSTTTEEDYCAIVNQGININTNDLISSAVTPHGSNINAKVKGNNNNISNGKKNNKKQKQQQQQQPQPKKTTTATTAETIIKKQQQMKNNVKEEVKTKPQKIKTTDVKPSQQQQQQFSTPTPPIVHQSVFPVNKPANKPNPAVAKILPEPKKPENLGAQFGPIGTSRSAWSNSPAEAKPPVSCSLLGRPVEKPLSPTPNSNQNGSPVHHHHLQHLHHTRGLSSGSPFHHPTAVGPIGAGYRQQQQQQQQQQNQQQSSPARASGSTFMQSLQLERRQRTEEYLRNRTEWPGFGEDTQLGGRNYLASLWDNTEEPRNQLDDIWPNSWGASLMGGNGGGGHQDEVLSVVEQQQQQQQSGLGFNPTQLTASVWSSEQENNNKEKEKSQNCWSSTLFKN